MLIVGLGNPGPEYALTRHNVGFMVADALVHKHRGSFTRASRLYDQALLRIAGKPFVVIKPLTYMNASGDAVVHAMRVHKHTPADVMIVVDEYNFPVGRVQLRQRGSDGGHNGVSSVIASVGTEAFWRLRLGIDRDFGPGQLVDYVLSPFPPDKLEMVNTMIADAVTVIEQHVRSTR